jgi:FkbM family methyltransferase
VIRSWGDTGPGSVSLLGYRIDYLNQSHTLFLIHEIFVNAAYAFAGHNPRARVVDCGANIGLSVLFFKALRPEAEVIAFEPDPVTFARLVRTVELNGLRNVQTENAAVGDRDGTVAFYTRSSDPGGLTASTDPSWGGDVRQDVPVVRLSSLLREPVDFLKLDVEGSEYAIVQDLIATGAIRLILEAVIEYHEIPSQPDGVTHLTTSLQAAGFEVTIVAANAVQRNGVIRARRLSPASKK